MKRKIYVFDLDGTLCEERPTFERSLAAPIQQTIDALNAFHDLGHRIIIYTARGWAEYDMTKAWLDDNYVKYDELILGKPIYDHWVDDRSIHPTKL